MVHFTKTDDPIKGVGFVAIYFANFEDTLDELVQKSGHLFTLPNKIDRWKFRDKAEWLQKEFRKAYASYTYPGSDEEGVRVDRLLKACRDAALKRNDIVHRPVFGDMQGGAMQKTTSGKMRALDVTKTYRFAEHINSLDGNVWGLQFMLGRLLEARRRSRGNG